MKTSIAKQKLKKNNSTKKIQKENGKSERKRKTKQNSYNSTPI